MCTTDTATFHFTQWPLLFEIVQKKISTVNSRFKKDLKLQIHLHKAFFSDKWLLDSLHKSFLNHTTLDIRKEKWGFLNRELTVIVYGFFKN